MNDFMLRPGWSCCTCPGQAPSTPSRRWRCSASSPSTTPRWVKYFVVYGDNVGVPCSGIWHRRQLRRHRDGLPEEHGVHPGQAARGRQPRGVWTPGDGALSLHLPLGHQVQGRGQAPPLAEDPGQVRQQTIYCYKCDCLPDGEKSTMTRCDYIHEKLQ